MADEIRVGNIGTIFEATIQEASVAVNISTTTVKQFIFKKPDGTIVTKTAQFVTDGTDGKLKYTTLANDLDLPGTWKIQANVTMPAWAGKTSIGSFKVSTNLA